jgi:TonB family protein
MKTKNILRLFLILIISGMFLSSPVIAGTPASECASTLWQKFQGTIRYPEFAYKQAIQGEVTVLFTVSENGKIIVKDIRSTDTELAEYIREVISRVQCPELANAGIYDFKVKFNFKLI